MASEFLEEELDNVSRVEVVFSSGGFHGDIGIGFVEILHHSFEALLAKDFPRRFLPAIDEGLFQGASPAAHCGRYILDGNIVTQMGFHVFFGSSETASMPVGSV